MPVDAADLTDPVGAAGPGAVVIAGRALFRLFQVAELDAPARADDEDGAALGDFLPSPAPGPLDALIEAARREAREAAP